MAHLNGVKLKHVDLKIDDKGQLKHEGEFVLELANGIQVGKQSFGGGYGEQYQFSPTQETMELRNKFFESIRNDINKSMGLGQ